ncbi:tetratricopeptide repeat protein [Candidatus Fermentibacteria bacterium]|nr:tetratricopeptide repeat protein [Candidatus Fermentibacteria bacterium]
MYLQVLTLNALWIRWRKTFLVWLAVLGIVVPAVPAQNADAIGAFRYAAGLFDMGEYELAAAEFDHVLSSFPGDSLAPSAAYWLGESLFQLERFGDAANAFSRAVRPSADLGLQEDARMRRAEALWAAGDTPGAILAYEAVLSAHPVGKYRGKASYWLGRAYVSAGRKVDAARVLRNAAAWGEDALQRAEAAYLAGDILRELSRCDEAGEHYRDVLRLTPHGAHAPAALEGLARCAIDAGAWESAAEALRTLTETFPTSPQASDGRFHLAECLSTLHRPTEALAAYKAVLRDGAAHALWDKALYGEAWAYAAAGDTVAALASFAQLATDFPTSALASEAAFREAQLAYAAGEHARAIRSFGRIMADWPTSAFVSSALYWRGWAHQKLGGLPQAERDFLNYAASYPDSQYAANALLLAGLAAVDQGSLSRGAEALERARKQYPGSSVMPQVLTALASAYSKLGEPARADGARSQLAVNHPETEEGRAALLQKGFSDLEEGRESAALASLSTLLSRPDIGEDQKAKAVYYLAEAHYRLHDWAEAESLYARSELMNAEGDLEDDSVYGRAWSALKAGKTEEAGRVFQRLAVMHPDSPFAAEAAFRYAQTLYDRGAYEDAAAAYGGLVNRHGGSEYADDAVYAGAWSLVKNGAIAEAAAQFLRLVEIYPASPLIPDALYDLGSCYSQLDRPAATARTLQQLLEQYPHHVKAPEAATALAYAYDALGQPARRDSVLSQMESQGSSASAAAAMLAFAGGKMEGDPDEARALLSRIIARHPDSPEAKEARLRLANFLTQEGRFAEAYDMVAALCSDDDAQILGRACVRAGETQFEMAEYEEAARFYRMALDEGTGIDRGIAWYGIAWSNLELGRRDAAIEALLRLFREHRQSPVWTDGSYRLGQLLADADRKKEAADVYAALGDDVELGSLALDATYRRAILLRERKAYTQAATLLRKVAAGSDSTLALQAMLELGRTLHEQGRLTEATDVFIQLAGRTPDERAAQQAMYSAGVCQTSMKRWKKAAEYFGKASAMPGPNRSDALLGEGWARAAAGEHQKASQLFVTILQETPDYAKGAEVAFRLAQSLQELGHYTQVDSICTELVGRQDWPYPDRALYLGATAKEKLGDTEGAIAAYRGLIEEYPSSSLVPYAKAHADALAGEKG